MLLLLTLLVYIFRVSSRQYYRKWILWYLAASLLTTTLALTLVWIANCKNNLFLFHFFTPLEYALLSALYYHSLKSKKTKKLLLISVPVFIAYAVFSSLVFQKISSNNSGTVIIESVLMILWVLLFLYEILLYREVENLTRFAMFWITVGILFYFTGNLVIEGMLDYMIRHSMKLAKRIYRFGYVFSYLLFILLLVGALAENTVQTRQAN